MKISLRYTDDEFVENLRKNLKWQKWFVVFYLIFLGLIFYKPISLSYEHKNTYTKYLEEFSKKSHPSPKEILKREKSKGFLAGFRNGETFAMGICCCIFVLIAFLIIFFRRRETKLLLKYHDELMKRNEDSLE